MIKVWQMVCAVSTWVAFYSGALRLHSWAHRRLYDAKYDGTPVAVYESLSDLAAWIAKQEWVADGWRELWDAVCTPNKVQAVGQGGNHKIGDCDEFAIYITAAVEKSLALGLMGKEKIGKARMMSVMWLLGFTPNGHNVCLMTFPDATDGVTWYAYMDYGMPSTKRRTIAEVAADVRAAYAEGSIPIGWAVIDISLKLEQFGFKE